MIDIDLPTDIHDALCAEFGKSAFWPPSFKLAERLLQPVIWYLGEDQVQTFFARAAMAAAYCAQPHNRDKDPGVVMREVMTQQFLGVVEPCHGDMHLLWPTIDALRESVGREYFEPFLNIVDHVIRDHAERQQLEAAS